MIFDLDNTLINLNGNVPRQTYHMLKKFKKQGYIIGIVSYDHLCHFTSDGLNLYDYSDIVKWSSMGRSKLFLDTLNYLKLKNNITDDNIEQIYYIDIQKDNIQNIKESFPNIITWYCTNVHELYNFKFII